jgi:hypothetical protein
LPATCSTRGSFPVIDVDRGGSIQGEIAALNRLTDLAVPSVRSWREKPAPS